MHRHLAIAVAALLFAAANCHATVQIRDRLTFEGQKGYIEEKPAWPLLENRNLDFVVQSTGNYSGFRSSWAIESNRLYLVTFSGRIRRQGPSRDIAQDIDLKWLFPESQGRVLASWFSGTVHLNLGARRLTALGGHITATDTLVVFTVDNGLILKRDTYSYPDNIDIINKRESESYDEPIDIRDYQ